MKTRKYIANIYIALWCLYGLQGTLYQTGGRLSQLLLAFLLSVSLCFFGFANLKYKLPTVLKVLSWLVVIWTIYGSINIILGNGAEWKIPSYYYLKNIYCSMLPIYAFYVLTKKGLLTESMLKKWVYVFVVIGILQFYRGQRLNQELLANRASTIEEFTNGAGYILVSILPLIPLFGKKPLVQYSLLTVCMVYVLMGMKRGAILSGAVCTVWFIIRTIKDYSKDKKRKKSIIWQSVLAVLFIVGTVYAVQYMMQTSDYFNERLDRTRDGDYSGRDVMYSIYYSYFINQDNAFHFLFGNGADATLRLFGEFAHNDWLEIAINNGLLILVLYAVYWINMFKTIRASRKLDQTVFIMLGMFFLIYLMKSFFSMSYDDITIYSCVAFGFAMARVDDLKSVSIVQE
jgi:hypothetical protein